MEVGKQTEPKMKPALDEKTFNKMYAEAEARLIANLAQERPKLAWKIILEYLLKIYKEEVRSERSKDPKVRSLDQLEAVAAEHREKSGTYPKWLKWDIEDEQQEEEFAAYLKFFCEAKSRFGNNYYVQLIRYIEEHHGEAYVDRLFRRRSYEGK